MTMLEPAGTGCPACGRGFVTTPKSGYHRCTGCATVWVPSRRAYVYDDQYPARRGHHQDAVARCKQVTLQSWLRRTGTAIQDRTVLEVGFGGGGTLAWMHDQGARVFGQEPVAANRDAAIQRGVPPSHVSADLAAFADRRFDVLLYLDAFEHILDPAAHLRVLDGMTAPGARALLVLPVADSVSRAVMRRWWPHDIEDHWIFYTTQGLAALWQAFGWRLAGRFNPWKFLSAHTIAEHFQMKTGVRFPGVPSMGLWLNFGERGLVFERSA